MTERETVIYPSYGERYITLRVQKYIEVVGPDETTGVGLTPTLRWKPFAGAESYEVTLYNVVSGKVVPLYNRVQVPTNSLKVKTPLKPDTLYGWSVADLSEYGVSIASSLSPRFSTSPRRTRTPVTVPSLGVRTVLFDDWEQIASNVFEGQSQTGAVTRLTFTKVDSSSPQTVLREQSVGGTKFIRHLVAERVWWAVVSGETFDEAYVATREGDDAYLIRVETEGED